MAAYCCTEHGAARGEMSYRIDLVGKKFGRLAVVKLSHINESHKTTMWECICECGTPRVVRRPALISGKTVSCGCLRKEAHQRLFKGRKW